MINAIVISIALMGYPQMNKTRAQWLPVVKSAATHYNLDWRLLDALIYQESNWNANAVSRAGAQGLAQLMPDTAEELKVKDSFDAGQNIWGAAWYLRRLYDRFKNWRLTLAAYNSGPTRVASCMCVPPIGETINYVHSILEVWDYERWEDM